MLRLYLALCVVAGHSSQVFPWHMHRSDQAVQVFYIVSGFYMAMVCQQGRYSSARDFYFSRFLRIFPLTWVVVALTVLVSLFFGLLTGHWFALAPYVSDPFSKNGAFGVLLAAISNVTLFGQDWVMFLSSDAGSFLNISRNFWNDRFPLWHYLLIPQCWSVGVELSFYLLVPFLSRQKNSLIVALMFASLTLRVAFYEITGLGSDPWSYRFFPFELATFCVGMLSYSVYEYCKRTLSFQGFSSFKGFLVLSASTLVVLYIAARGVGFLSRIDQGKYSVLVIYPFWGMMVAALFFVSRRNMYDRIIGELSFPVYLTHVLVITLLNPAFRRMHFPAEWVGPIAACLSMLISIFLYLWFIKPIDEARHHLTMDKARGTASVPTGA